MAEKTKLITQLRDAKNLIEQLEQDKVKKNTYDTKIWQGALKFTFGSNQKHSEFCFPKLLQLLP